MALHSGIRHACGRRRGRKAERARLGQRRDKILALEVAMHLAQLREGGVAAR